MGRVRVRGFLLKQRVATLFHRVFRRQTTSATYRRLNQPRTNRVKSLERFCKWTQRLRTKAKAIISKKMDTGRNYIRVGQEPVQEKLVPVPKGHVAVYVGQKDGEFERVLVPVVYCNHPLFSDLLKESENEYGFDHPGGITIPCRVAEFERVQTRIKAGLCTHKLLGWKRSGRSWMV